jgi:hypothetical protein
MTDQQTPKQKQIIRTPEGGLGLNFDPTDVNPTDLIEGPPSTLPSGATRSILFEAGLVLKVDGGLVDYTEAGVTARLDGATVVSNGAEATVIPAEQQK